MRLSSSDLRDLADLAILAADAAGQMIANSRPVEVQRKAGVASLASQVVTEIDRRSEEIILDVLSPTLERFELGLLTEEQDDDGSRRTADHFWCIDPLDGTLPFVEGLSGYAVSIALVRGDGVPLIGVIQDPVLGTVIYAISGAGAFRDSHPWLIEPPTLAESAKRGVLSVFADRSFLHREDHDELVDALSQIARDVGLEGVRFDSTRGAVMNACGVLANPTACYFKFPRQNGGGSLWDFSATACVFSEASQPTSMAPRSI